MTGVNDGKVLTADSLSPLGMKWASLPNPNAFVLTGDALALPGQQHAFFVTLDIPHAGGAQGDVDLWWSKNGAPMSRNDGMWNTDSSYTTYHHGDSNSTVAGDVIVWEARTVYPEMPGHERSNQITMTVITDATQLDPAALAAPRPELPPPRPVANFNRIYIDTVPYKTAADVYLLYSQNGFATWTALKAGKYNEYNSGTGQQLWYVDTYGGTFTPGTWEFAATMGEAGQPSPNRASWSFT